MKRVIHIKNLDCAACAAELSEELKKVEGVQDAAADFINQRVTLAYEGEDALQTCIDVISHFEEVEIVDGNAPRKKERHLKEIVSIAVSLVCFIPALVLELCGYETASLVLFLCAFLAAGWRALYTVACGFLKIFKQGLRGFILFDENFLMTLAAAGAFALGQNMEGAIVMILYEIGELLQNIAVASSRGAIEKLMELKTDVAIRITGEAREEIPPEELSAGDVILLRKGDRTPVDCRLLEPSSFDTKSLTGEAYLKEAEAGEEILAGCVNEGNAVRAEVVRPVSESAVSKILELVENSSAAKAKPEKFITKFARIYTPVVVLAALLIGVVPPLFQDYNFTVWIPRALNFLVISCPCALIISVPLTYFSGVGTLARHGVLAKGAVGLDALAKVKVAAFDKTGTLTEGKFTVGRVNGDGRALAIAAGVEQASSHPLAQAFRGIEGAKAEEVRELAGRGLSAVVGGKAVLVGSLRLMREHGIPAQETGEGVTVYVAEDGKLVGSVEIADRVRPEAGEALRALKDAGVHKIAVLTGDSAARAEATLKELPVDEICADLLPADKPARAERLKTEGALLYVGDGINDTPVMAESDVAVAMGGLGSDAAIEASDFVLASDTLTALPKAVKGARKTRKIVFENIVFSIAVKLALMGLSLAGFVPLWAAVLGDVGVMLLAVLNSLRMRRRIA